MASTLSADQYAAPNTFVNERGAIHPSTPRPFSMCHTASVARMEDCELNRRFSEIPQTLPLERELSYLFQQSDYNPLSNQNSDHSAGSTRHSSVVPQAPRIPQIISYPPSICESTLTTPTINADIGDSDALSSVYDFAIYDFPEPPPIGSPVIRRMRSSPWFMAGEEQHAFPYTPSPKAQTFDFNAVAPPQRKEVVPDMPRYADVFGSENSLFPTGIPEDGQVGIDCRRRSVFGIPVNVSQIEDISTIDETSAASTMTRGRSFTMTSTRHDVNSSNPSEEGGYRGAQRAVYEPLATQSRNLPRIIRKVASMRTEVQRQDSYVAPSVFKAHRPVPKMRSFRSILGKSDREAGRRDSWQLPSDKSFWTRRRDKGVKAEEKGVQAERKQEAAGCRASKRFSSNLDIFEVGDAGSKTRRMPTPFASQMGLKQDQDQSFLDFGPSSSSGSTKEKVKTLLSRASGFFVRGRRQQKKSSPLK